MSTNDESIDLDGLRALAEKATPGPWEADGNEVSQHWSRPEPWKTVASSEVACMSYCYGGSGRGIENEADAEFIAAANPSTVLALVARVRAAEARAERFDEVGAYAALREELSRVREAHTVHMQRANKRLREAEARIEKVVRLRDRMERQRDDIDESVRLSMILVDLNAALTEGDEQ